MGRVVSSKGYNKELRVLTIDWIATGPPKVGPSQSRMTKCVMVN